MRRVGAYENGCELIIPMVEIPELRPPELRSPPAHPSPTRKFLPVAGILCGLLTLLFFKAQIKNVLLGFFRMLEGEFEQHPVGVLLFLGFLFLLVQSLMLPLSLLCMTVSFLFKSFWPAYAFCVFSGSLASAAIFFFGHKLTDSLLLHLQDSAIVSMLVEETTRSPLKISIIIRLLGVPAGLKDYLLVLGNSPFHAYICSAVLAHGVFSFASVLLGLGIEELETIFVEGRSWSQKSSAEKITMIIFLFVGIFTLLAIFVISWWAMRKINEKKTRKEVDAQMVKFSGGPLRDLPPEVDTPSSF